eukprot:128472_1
MSYYMKEPIFRGPIILCPQCKKMGIRKLLKNCPKHSSNKNNRNLSSHSQSFTKYANKNTSAAFDNDDTGTDNNDQNFSGSLFNQGNMNYSQKQNNCGKYYKNNSNNYDDKPKTQRQYIGSNNHSDSNNNSTKHSKSNQKYSLERIAPCTIDLAETTGIYTPDQIGYLKATKNSEEKEDVLYHRGVEYTLKKGLESVGMKWKDFPESDFNCDKIKNEYKMNKQERHNEYDNPQNLPGLSEILFPNDSEMAQGFKEWVNEYDGLDDIQDCFD